MKAGDKDWSCPKKQKARWETIISQYQSNFSQSMPKEKQYWSMCSQCADDHGNPSEGRELSQMVSGGLISQGQFHGVEINKGIHDLNVSAYPDENWHNKDMYQAMAEAHGVGEFNPGIVNLDLIQTPETGASYISRCMALLTATSTDLVVIANFILRKRFYNTKSGDYAVEALNRYPQFRYAMTEGKWKMCESYYSYDGTGDTGSRTWMGSLIFVQKETTACS